jgi:hypothetical protein
MNPPDGMSAGVRTSNCQRATSPRPHRVVGQELLASRSLYIAHILPPLPCNCNSTRSSPWTSCSAYQHSVNGTESLGRTTWE